MMLVAKEGVLLSLVLIGLGVALCLLNVYLSLTFIVLGIYVAYFFRKPCLPATFVASQNKIISPAWGKVTSVRDHPELPTHYEISIFLSIFDVHLQCMPVSGEISALKYKEGKFLNALDPLSGIENEQNAIEIKALDHPEPISVIQIAGLIARRIRCFASKGDKYTQGQYFGLIQFGSRVNISIPKRFQVKVTNGDRVNGFHTVLAEI